MLAWCLWLLPHTFADGGRSGFLPGARQFAPDAHPQARPPIFYDDDDEDDNFDDFFRQAQQHHDDRRDQPRRDNGARPSISAGGKQDPGFDPVRTKDGIVVGGGTTHGVVSDGKVEPVTINTETGEGSNEIVTDFNFPDADILDIAKTLGKLTGKNFILDKDVKGRISIISNSPITVGEAWKVFLTALDMNQLAIIPSGKYLRIARQRDARDKQLPTFSGDSSPNSDALITRIFSLKYISAEEVSRTFRTFMPANSRIIPYDQTNTVIVTDTGSDILKVAKMLELLDVEGFDAGIEVIPVRYASAQELSKLIDTLIPGTSGVAPAGGAGGRFAGSKFNARRTKEGGIINTIIADERTNNLIVHANSRGAEQVRLLVTKLDQRLPTSTGGGKVHVVYLQFADAEQIGTTLNALTSGGGSGTPPPKPQGGTGSNPVSASLFEGSIRISPDKATNSLVITTASPSDFVTVQRVINRLDIPREQVYVEVVVMEVSIGNNFNFSANLAAAMPPSLLAGTVTNGGDLLSMVNGTAFSTPGAFIPLPLSGDSTTAVTLAGTTYTISSVLGLVKMLQQNANANVLATPQIIALDNTEASFESAEMIPVPSATSIQGAGGAISSFNDKSVSLSIKIKPQINKITNFVKMDVTAKMGDISNRQLPKNVSDSALATLVRTATTTAIVGDADTIVLGGLIRDKTEVSTNKVPLLGDIPLLGWLFRSRTSSVTKNNLLIFITPHIVRQYAKIRTILDRKLKERDDFIESNMGGEDGLRKTRNNIIANLPDLEDLTKKNETTISIDEDKGAPAIFVPPVQEATPPPASLLAPDTSIQPSVLQSTETAPQTELPQTEPLQAQPPEATPP